MVNQMSGITKSILNNKLFDFFLKVECNLRLCKSNGTIQERKEPAIEEASVVV